MYFPHKVTRIVLFFLSNSFQFFKANFLLLPPQPYQNPPPRSGWLKPQLPVWLSYGSLETQNPCPTTWSSTEPNPPTMASRKLKVWLPTVTASAGLVRTLNMSFVSWLLITLATGLPATLWRHAQVNRPPPHRLYTSKRGCWAPAQC